MCIIHRDLNSHNCLIKLVCPTALGLPGPGILASLSHRRLTVPSCFRPEVSPRAPTLPFLLPLVLPSVFWGLQTCRHNSTSSQEQPLRSFSEKGLQKFLNCI